MLDELKERVFLANLELEDKGLVLYTWGNVSGFSPKEGLVVIKPSGIPYSELKKEDMVVVDLKGRVVSGRLRPSSDTPTHLELYRNFQGIGGVVHTHSLWATTWAQARMPIPALGTTHADYFFGEIPCTRALTSQEISTAYEANTGKVIVSSFKGIPPLEVPGALAAGHGPFTWGRDPEEAVYHSVVLEELAKMAYHTVKLNPEVEGIPHKLLAKHFLRKHGEGAYYGQQRSE